MSGSESAPGRLICLQYSHFCELGRWALLKPANGKPRIPFREEDLPLGVHRRVVPQYKVGEKDKSSMPIFVQPDGHVLQSSWEILEYAGYQIDEPFRLLLAEKLGPAARRVAYHYILQRDGMLRDIQNASSLWHSILFHGLWMFIDLPARLRYYLRIEDGYCPDEDVAIMKEVFEEVERRLSDGAEYLGENGEFGGADIAFASLGAVILWPDETLYADGRMSHYKLESMHEGLVTLAKQFRDTVAGRHVLKVYKEHRPAP